MEKGINRSNIVKSMTGFGRGEYVDEKRRICIEMKSVNHRYLDLGIRMPKKLNILEAAIRNEIKKFAQRGKIDIFVTYEDLTEHNVGIKYNAQVAKEYYDILTRISEQFSLPKDISIGMLSKYPEVITMEEQPEDEDELWKMVRAALTVAGEKFAESRVCEGNNLCQDLITKLDEMITKVQYVEERSPMMQQEYKERLETKVRELLDNNQIDEARILTEVTIFADRVCVDEELVRLKSHIDTMKNTLLQGDGVGRKLDFIAQEMNREANTILSKVSDIDITNCAIDLKTDIEKIREQVQNIE